MPSSADHHLQRAIDQQTHNRLGTHPLRAQVVRQTVGVRIQRRVAQLTILVHRRNRIRSGRRLRRKQRRQAAASHRARRRVPLLHDPMPLIGRKDLKAADRSIRRSNRALQNTHQTRHQSRNAAPVEQVGLVVEPQMQLLARHHDQSERIMRRVAPADLRQSHATRFDIDARPVNRVVLEHNQGVEQLAQSGKTLDLGKAEMLVRRQLRLAVLRLFEKIAERLGRRQLEAQRQRVDEQPHHVLDAGNLRRPPRYRHAEHHVVAPGHAAEQDRPGGLQHRVERHPLPTCFPAQRRGQCGVERECDVLRRDGDARARLLRHMGGLLKTSQRLPPSRHGALVILRREEREIIAIGRNPRQRRGSALAGIELEQLPHQHGGRPAIHQKVMIGDHQPVLLCREAH